MSTPVENLPQLIGPNTSDELKIQIKDARVARENRSRLLGGAAVEVNATIDRLTDATNDADAALVQIQRPGETFEDTFARIDGDNFATDRERSLVNASRSSRLSLESEQRAKDNMAVEFATETFDNDVLELKQAFETAMRTEIFRVSRKEDIDKMAAKTLVDQDVAIRGQAVVLPIYHRIYSRFAAKYPDQIQRAEAG